MKKTKRDGLYTPDTPVDRKNRSGNFSMPIGGVKSARLVFETGVGQLSLKVDRIMDDLYRVEAKHQVPRVRFHEETLTIQYPFAPALDPPVSLGEALTDIYLNGSIPWEIEFRSHLSGLKAELTGLQLLSLDILGGASHLELWLSEPAGTSFIYISGGIYKGVIHRPLAVGVRVQIAGEVKDLALDHQHLRAADGETSLESAAYHDAASRYHICISGGVSQLTIQQRGS